MTTNLPAQTGLSPDARRWPVIYALGTLTTGLSFLVIAITVIAAVVIRRRQDRHGSDAGKA